MPAPFDQTIRDAAHRADCEDAVIEVAALASQKARRLGLPPATEQGAIEAIFSDPQKIHARCLLLDSWLHLTSATYRKAERRVIAALRAQDRLHPDGHEQRAMLWREIKEAAEAEEAEAWEYVGDVS